MMHEFSDHEYANERLALLAALVDGDGLLAYRMAAKLLRNGVPFSAIIEDVFAPVHTELGRRWAVGDVGIAEEHAASAAIEELVIRLGSLAEEPEGATVVVTTAEHDAHALGARVVATALALDGFRVVFLGASVPAADLGEMAETHEPLAVALSCSVVAALADAAETVRAAHDAGVAVVAGGRALEAARARRLGVDAFVASVDDAVAQLHAWEVEPPPQLAPTPDARPEHAALADAAPLLIAESLHALDPAPARRDRLADELVRAIRVVESALLVDESALVDEYVAWLRATGPVYGFDRASIDRALHGLVGAAGAGFPHVAAALARAL